MRPFGRLYLKSEKRVKDWKKAPSGGSEPVQILMIKVALYPFRRKYSKTVSEYERKVRKLVSQLDGAM